MENLIYLDNASTTFPKPQEVYDFMYNFYQKHGINPGRSTSDVTAEAEEVVYSTRKMLTEFFNGKDPNHLTFSYNASDSLNMIIQGMVEKGDHIVSTKLEHNSVLRPLNVLQRDGICEVTYVPFDSNGYLDPDDIKKAIKKNTKMVIVNHGSNVLGTVQPIAEIGKICRELGCWFAVDTSQTAGVQKIDVQEMCIDLLAFTGHKSLMGPTGIGGAYVGENVPIRPTRYGGTGIASAYPYHLDEFPHRLECGTLNILGVAGLNASQKWIRSIGIENIHKQEMELWDKLRKNLQEIENVTTYCADTVENHNPVLSFSIKGWKAEEIGAVLNKEYNIACRAGLHCAPKVHEQLGTDKIYGTVRLSLGPFNTEEHIDQAIEAVREIAARKH